MEESTELTDKMIDAQGRWLRFKQLFSRLLSPVL
jgi:cardiolipin synthase